MKKVVFVILLLLAPLLVAARAEAQPAFDRHGPFGLGIILGEPSGISGCIWASDGNKFNFLAHWSVRHEWFGGAVDYQYAFWDLLPSGAHGALKFPVSIGGGGVFALGDDVFWVGARVPVDIAMAWTRVPLEVFLQLAPVLWLVEDTDLDGMGGIGVRYYF